VSDVEILMPQLGETVSEGKITTWFKAVGDAVQPGDNLFEIETDKVSMEVPATAPGVLAEIRVAVGQVVPVGAIVAIVSDGVRPNGGSAAAAPSRPTAGPSQPRLVTFEAPSRNVTATPPAAALDPFNEVHSPERHYGPARLADGRTATPLARRLAAEAGLDLARLAGSGSQGRIVARDIRLAAERTAPQSRGVSVDDVKALYSDRPYREIALDAMRRTIARRLTEAVTTIPHFHVTADIEVEKLIGIREEANASAPKDETGRPAFRLSINDFLIKALALALQRVPAANSVFAQDRILRFQHSDIGVAVALEGGLLTPVIHAAETLALSSISEKAKDLAARARERRLRPDEYQGGVTAISNLGMYGVREFSAIINPPHATILAVGAVQKRPVERDGTIAFVHQMTVTLSCDHRVVDGALGAELLTTFKGFVEQPVTMLI